MKTSDGYAVPQDFETAHDEWLKEGGPKIGEKFRFGAQPAFYRTAYWKAVRQAVLKRDNSRCYRCGSEAIQVHHLHYRFRCEDHLHPESLVSICRECHGLVEYARLAEDLIRKFSYRLSCARKFIAGQPGFANETPVKTLSRLLEYKCELEDLQQHFAANRPYGSRSEVGSREEFSKHYTANLDRFQKEAEAVIASWEGQDKEKTNRIIGLIEEESRACTDFIAKVLRPVSA